MKVLTSSRRRRAERPAARPSELTDRDRRLLRAVGRMKVATTGQVAVLFFNGPRPASRRLAKLLALRLLDVHVPSLATPNLYTLSKLGSTWLAEQGVDESELHVGAVPGRAHDLAHLTAINDVRVALILSARRHPGVSITLFESDHDLRRLAGTKVPAYLPDALVELATGSAVRRFVLEVDLGTESAAFFTRTKAVPVNALARASAACWGLPWPWRPVLVAHSTRRLQGLAKAMTSAGAGGAWLGAVLADVATDDALAHPLVPLDACAPGAGAQGHSLLGLDSSLSSPPVATATTGAAASLLTDTRSCTACQLAPSDYGSRKNADVGGRNA